MVGLPLRGPLLKLIDGRGDRGRFAVNGGGSEALGVVRQEGPRGPAVGVLGAVDA